MVFRDATPHVQRRHECRTGTLIAILAGAARYIVYDAVRALLARKADVICAAG
jgi:hypothetical protein